MSEGILATAAEVAAATGGALRAGDPAAVASCVSTDSRVPARDSLFVALSGENFDGARFCADAVRSGSTIVLVSREALDRGLPGLGDAAVVAVDDTLRALAALAGWHRQRHAARIVAITGSNGKTSTKEMTASALGGPPGVLYNRGNFNNQVGMPRALLSLRASHHHAVLEMGMNAPGEIQALARIARPQVGVVTNVHPVHLEGLGSIDAVARAKGELLEALPPDGVAVLNADDPYVLKQAERTAARRVTFGRGPAADVRVVEARPRGGGLDVVLSLPDGTIDFTLPRPGAHNALNAAAAAAVGLTEGVDPATIAERLPRTALPRLRMERLEMGGGAVLVDCYNANPRSVHVAVQTAVELGCEGGAYAVLGDMRELGEASGDLHRQTGCAAAEAGLSGLCAFGEQAGSIARGARDCGLEDVEETRDVDAAVRWCRQRLAGAVVLIKGSRAMRMERIAARLAASFSLDWGREVQD
jgi:UDP-N-acetylmuramoyl-tripeptide--D-alanyl-D-alanine ligase